MEENSSKNNNPWSALSTISTFDKGNNSWSTRRIDDPDMQTGGQIVGRVAPSTSLLIESLIKQLCTMFEGDVDRRNKLYFAICDRLHEMKLIDGSYNLIEFEIMRGQYQIALYKLVTIARASTGSESPLQVPNCLMAEWSRYRREFKELGFIDAGGFGNVYKALHRLDGHEYAIKKIVVRSGRVKTIMQHLEEVKTIARLNHTNIVSYKGAWIESTFPESFVPSLPQCESRDLREDSGVPKGNDIGFTNSLSYRSSHRKSKKNSSSKSNESESESNRPSENNRASESGKNTYKTGMYVSIENKRETDCRRSSGGYLISHDIINERFHQLNSTTNIIGERISERCSSRISEDGSSDIVSFRRDTQESKFSDNNDTSSCTDDINGTDDPEDSESYDEEAISENRVIQYNSSRPTPQQYATLYIQMGLCDQTLRQWIDERVDGTPMQLVTAIITQILSGLEYIHSIGIVHHDIKPKNIFISTSGNLRVQLGDFGLACPLQRESHHSGLGTPTYAAPEQLNGNCDPKSDVYSLGIVLLELLVPMQTHMERSRIIDALKSGQIPTALATNQPKWAQIVSQLVQEDPKSRPTTTELLQNLSEDKDLIIAKLKEENVKKDDEIRELRDRLAQLEAKIGMISVSLDNT